MDGNLLQNIVFKVFALCLDSRGIFRVTKGSIGIPVYFRDKLEELSFKPGEIGQFSSFGPIFLFASP